MTARILGSVGSCRYDCHEGNYPILQSLGGGRAEDRAIEEDLARGASSGLVARSLTA